jgi:hypothetical protein
VFTNEIEQSLLPAAVSQIGAAIVGPTVKGPAFQPTKVSSFAEYQEIFGGYTEDSYVPFTAAEYLRNGNALTVTRLLPEDGFTLTSGSIALFTATQVSEESGFFATTQITYGYMTHVLMPTVAVNSGANFGKTTFVTSSAALPFGHTGTLTLSGSWTQNTDVPGTQTFTSGTGIAISLNPSDPNYITKIFGRSPKSTQYPVYVAYEDPDWFSSRNNPIRVDGDSTYTYSPGAVGASVIRKVEFTQSYQEAYTPYITSQYVTGTTTLDLFRFATLSHGNNANWDVKVGIRDVRTALEVADPDGYGTFTVEVRKVNSNNNPYAHYKSNDTDRTPETIEVFRNVNLNPASPKYIGKVIGDRYQTIDANGIVKFNGDFENKSKYIRVDIKDNVKNQAIDKTLIPFGFRQLYNPILASDAVFAGYSDLGVGEITTFGNLYFQAPVYATTQVVGNSYHKNNYLGFDYTYRNNLNFLAPIPSSGSTLAGSPYTVLDFYLGSLTQDAQAAFPSLTAPYSGSIQTALQNGSGSLAAQVALATRKFMVPFQGGADGARPNLPKLKGKDTLTTNTFGLDCSGLSTAGTKLYNKAFDILSNTDYYDLNMLLTPGVYDVLHSNVTTAARNLCLDRQDSFYVMDLHTYNYQGSDVSIQDVVETTTDLDNNYTATYWPWVKINNPTNNIPQWVPPSVVVPGALTFNDRVSAPWYAPAGLNRGGLTSVTNTYQALTQNDRNSLYDSRINPIANFPNDGIVVWGQKTLQAAPSALDRVNVRRLLITVKKFIASATKYLVFDQNNDVTRTKFLNIVNPYLESVRVQQGLSAFKVVMDNTNNTADMIDQGILYGQLFLQPTRTAEFIVLDFNVQPTGASFPE